MFKQRDHALARAPLDAQAAIGRANGVLFSSSAGTQLEARYMSQGSLLLDCRFPLLLGARSGSHTDPMLSLR